MQGWVGLDDWDILIVFLAVPAVPLLSLLFKNKRHRLWFGLSWLVAISFFLLRPAANYPHPFGHVLFLPFLLGWTVTFAMSLTLKGRNGVVE